MANNPKTSGKLTKQIQLKHKEDQQLKKPEKPASWLQVRSFFSSKLLQPHQHEQKQQPKPLPIPPPTPPQKQQQKQHPQKKQEEPRKKKKEIKEQQHQVDLALEETSKRCKKMRCSGSICSNTKVMHRPETTTTMATTTTVSPEALQRKRAASSLVSSSRSSSKQGSSSYSSSSRSMKASSSFNELSGGVVGVPSSNIPSSNNVGYGGGGGGTFKGMPFRKFSGCYECRMVVDPVLAITRDPSMRGSICSCPDCGEIFMKPESLELHQAVRHAVSELGPEDTSKNIVEIIFQSSWLKKQAPICKIDRILKVHNTQRTISKFEEYRDSIKAKATKRHPRCVADGNELLRFYCTTLSCSLGLDGSSNLCSSIPRCNICSIIKNGFAAVGSGQQQQGILTTATSGKAHDNAAMVEDGNGNKRAMLVCRVIAGRVKKSSSNGSGGDGSPSLQEEYDSVGGDSGVYSNLDELFVFNPKAILPCFVVIYRGF